MSKKNHRRHKRKQFQRQTGPGAPPGSVIVDPAAKPTQIQAILYGPSGLEEHTIDNPARLAQLVGKFPVMWVNVDGLGDARLIEEIGRIFGLHPLALEDVVNVHQRAKVEPYKEHLFLVARMPSLKVRFETEQISFFLCKHALITFQEDVGDCWDPVRARLRNSTSRLRALGADFLCYALIDSILDGYYPILDVYEERLDKLEDAIGESFNLHAIAPVHDIRSDLRQMRRAIGPHREALGELLRDAGVHFSEETRFHLRDCYDHVIQIIDAVDIYREMCTDLREFHLSKVSARTNDVMKVLTIIATIFMPLSFIASVYGMNFDTDVSRYNMPELLWPYGYFWALGLMTATALSMVSYFWRKGWLRGDRSARRPGS